MTLRVFWIIIIKIIQTFIAEFSTGNPSYKYSLMTTWSMSFMTIQQSHPQATELFQLLAFLNHDGVLIDFLQARVETLPKGLKELISNRHKLSTALIELEKFSLLKWN